MDYSRIKRFLSIRSTALCDRIRKEIESGLGPATRRVGATFGNVNGRLSATVLLIFLLGACDEGGNATTSIPPVKVASTASTVDSTTTTEPPTPPTISTTTTSVPDPADVVFRGGDIVTMDPELGTAEAIAITGEVIAAVGTAEEIERYVGPGTTVVDLGGRALSPGFVDAHTHILTDMGGIAAGQRLALANGITSVGDASVEPEWPEQFIEAATSGELAVRTTLYLARTDPCGEDLGPWYVAYGPDAILAERVRVGGVKIFSDGGVCGAIATSEPFLEGYEAGAPYHDLGVLTAWIREADAAGYQVIIHAQGDRAIAEVQDAFAAVLDGRSNTLRHRIEHNAFVTEAIAGRYGELGLVPTVFGISEACRADLGWTDFYKEYGDRPGAIGAANPGLVVAWHGDDPWMTPISPILELFSLVTRVTVGEDGTTCEPPDWMAGGGVSVEQGLAMMTTGSAYALRQDQLVGSLAPGKLADLVVLSDNLLTVPIDQLPSVAILATVIGGTTEYCAPGADAWCPGYTASGSFEASASRSREGHGPELVFDGSVIGESFWSSGGDAPDWIKVDFAGSAKVTEVRFVVYQNPPGETVHELEVFVDGTWNLVETFRGTTATGDVLIWHPASPLAGVSAFRMTTLESLSWPEWFEIEIDSAGE